MRLQVLGIGNAFSSIHYNTSFLLEGKKRYLIDCPPALFRLLAERGIDPAEVNDAIITHVHGDHTAGLETLILWKKYVQRTKLRVWTSAPVYAELKTRFFPGFSQTFTPDLHRIREAEFEEYVDFSELSTDHPNRLEEDLDVEIRYNWHPTATLGLRISGSPGRISISGDNCYNPALLAELLENRILSRDGYEKLAGDWLWQADLIYHEVERGHAGLHTSEEQLLSLPDSVRAKLRLVHISDDFTEGPLPVAREGEVVTFSQAGATVISRP